MLFAGENMKFNFLRIQFVKKQKNINVKVFTQVFGSGVSREPYKSLFPCLCLCLSVRNQFRSV